MNQDQYTVGRLFQPTGCLSQDMLLRYADNQLSRSEQREVECHLIDCGFCDDALQGIQQVGTAAFRKSMEAVADRMQRHQAPQESPEQGGQVIEFRPSVHPPVAAPKRSGLITYLSIAASVAVLAVLGILFLGGSSNAGVADDYFKDFSAEYERSDTHDAQTTFDEALGLFGQQKYQDAAPLFDKVGTPGATARAANCYFRLGQYDLAATRFQSVMEQKTSIYADPAAFDLALTYLKLGRDEEATSLLQSISADKKHSFSGKAQQVLDDIE